VRPAQRPKDALEYQHIWVQTFLFKPFELGKEDKYMYLSFYFSDILLNLEF